MLTLFLLGVGGIPRAVFPALLRNEKSFSLQAWQLFSLISGSQFALSSLRIDNSDYGNESSNYQLVTLPNFAKFRPQTTEIQPFKVECFSTKTLEFQHDDVIISDVSEDFGIFFGMWNRLAMSYLCAKFCCDTTLIACNTCIFHVYFFSYRSTEVSA